MVWEFCIFPTLCNRSDQFIPKICLQPYPFAFSWEREKAFAVCTFQLLTFRQGTKVNCCSITLGRTFEYDVDDIESHLMSSAGMRMSSKCTCQVDSLRKEWVFPALTCENCLVMTFFFSSSIPCYALPWPDRKHLPTMWSCANTLFKNSLEIKFPFDFIIILKGRMEKTHFSHASSVKI